MASPFWILLQKTKTGFKLLRLDINSETSLGTPWQLRPRVQQRVSMFPRSIHKLFYWSLNNVNTASEYFFFFLLIISSSSIRGNPSELPTFGDRLSGTISIEKERKLGQQFLRSLRAQAPILDDPILQDYLEHLIYRLAVHSELEDKRIDLKPPEKLQAFVAKQNKIYLQQ